MRPMRWLCRRLGWLTEDGMPAVRWHAQNLSDDRFGRLTKPLWRDGRGWLRTPWATFAMAWTIPTRFCHVGFDSGGGDGELFGLELACWLFAVWFHYEPARWRQVRSRSYQLSWHDGGLWCQWGTNQWGDMPDWKQPPRWRRWHFDPMDFLLGRMHYDSRDLQTRHVEIPTPEGLCPARVRFFESTWKRPRWPWWPLTRRMVRSDIDLQKPIPIPGKGENSWDCDEDAIYSLTCRATTVAEAVAAVVKSYVETRERHGGSNWRPAEAAQ